MELRDMIGKRITAWAVKGDTVEATLDDRCVTLEGEGECCASCWIEHADGIDPIGATISEITVGGWKVLSDEDMEVSEQGFYVIRTDKGDITLDLRLNHNGYYGGELVCTLRAEED